LAAVLIKKAPDLTSKNKRAKKQVKKNPQNRKKEIKEKKVMWVF